MGIVRRRRAGQTAERAGANESTQTRGWARLGRQSKGLPRRASFDGDHARQDVRRYAAEQGLAGDVAVERGLQKKAPEYRRAGAGGIDSAKASPQGPDDWETAGSVPAQRSSNLLEAIISELVTGHM